MKSIVESISKYKNLNERESNKDETKYITLESYLNKNIKESKKRIESKKLTPIVIGNGKIVVEQYPKKGETIVSTSKVFLKTNGTKIKMIDITGWNRAEVITFMNMIGVDYEINGTGKVLNFNIKVGEVIKEKVIISMESEAKKEDESKEEKEN